jgi:hypothetical protein
VSPTSRRVGRRVEIFRACGRWTSSRPRRRRSASSSAMSSRTSVSICGGFRAAAGKPAVAATTVIVAEILHSRIAEDVPHIVEPSGECGFSRHSPVDGPFFARVRRRADAVVIMRALIIAAVLVGVVSLSPALAETLYCSTSVQGYRICSSPGGATSTEWRAGKTNHRAGQRWEPLDDNPMARWRHHQVTRPER